MEFNASASKLTTQCMDDPLRARLGYAFRNPDLLRAALTHRSFGASHNERLEFVGDAVLNCVVAASLYERFRLRLPKATCRAPALRSSTRTRSRVSRAASRSAARSGWAKASTRAAAAIVPRSSPMRSRRCSARCSSTAATMRRARSSNSATATCSRAPILRRSARIPRRGCRSGCRRAAWRSRSTRVATSGEAHAQVFDVECRIPALDLVATGRGSSRRAAEQARGRGMRSRESRRGTARGG